MADIDPIKLKALMRMKPTLEDTAAFFDCSTKTIQRFITDNYQSTFVQFRQKHLVHTRHDLVRKAIEMALKGQPALMIFCLKNVCGWGETYGEAKENEEAEARSTAITPEQAKVELQKRLKVVSEKP